jgi:hypothetical protein
VCHLFTSLRALGVLGLGLERSLECVFHEESDCHILSNVKCIVRQQEKGKVA